MMRWDMQQEYYYNGMDGEGCIDDIATEEFATPCSQLQTAR